MTGIIDMNNTGIKMPGFFEKQETRKPKKDLSKILICKSNKLYKKFGINKGTKIKIEIERFNLISFYDTEIKKVRYISLSPKHMKKFKEVK